jgi:elongation factor P
MTNGKIVDNTFSAGAKIDEVRVERRKFQYLYEDEDGLNFMNNEDFEQIVLNKKLIDRPDLIKEGMEVDMLYHGGTNQLLTLELPQTVIMKITYTEPGLKGDTATNAFKPATVETGAEVRVPLFINEGDLIKIDTQTGAYMERIKQ